MVERHGYFALALGQWFAVLESNEPGDFIPASAKLGGNLVKPFAPLFSWNLPPSLKCGMSVLNGLRDRGSSDCAHSPNGFALRRIADLVGSVRDLQFTVQIDRKCFHLET